MGPRLRVFMIMGMAVVVTAAANGRWLSIQQLSERLQMPEKTLRYWRSIGYGPAATKFGRGRQGTIRYSVAGVEAWEAERQAEGVAS